MHSPGNNIKLIAARRTRSMRAHALSTNFAVDVRLVRNRMRVSRKPNASLDLCNIPEKFKITLELKVLGCTIFAV